MLAKGHYTITKAPPPINRSLERLLESSTRILFVGMRDVAWRTSKHNRCMASRMHSTAKANAEEFSHTSNSRTYSFPTPPTEGQLRTHFLTSTIPMVGFGLMDQTIMIQAGNAIDCTIGVTFGLSTLTAAALGQIVSNAGGVLFGGTIDQMARRAGLPCTGFTAEQRALPSVRRVGVFGNFVGVILGCTLGLFNLWLVDTDRSSTLKLRAAPDSANAFEVEASNRERHDATTLKISGPDVDGILASMTATLTDGGFSLLEVHAGAGDSRGVIKDIFVIQKRNKKEQVEDDELKVLAKTLINAIDQAMKSKSTRGQTRETDPEESGLQDSRHSAHAIVEETQVAIVTNNPTHVLAS